MNQHPVWPFVDEQQPRFRALSDAVWAVPETCYAERKSAALHIKELEHQGFRITRNVADIPTAVIGEWGDSGPLVAFLGEYDALAALSQEADVAEFKPLEEGANGHGCGHNLLGSAAMLAATAVRDWLRETGTEGRVRYYGCPAEEGGSAKAFMVKAGVFNDVDIVITWHPASIASVMRSSSLAAARVDFTFTGRASHAAASPQLGRSALDAVELMSVGVNYLREHMSDQARIHYAYLDAGGISPNVVQASAKVRYVIREPRTREMKSLIERVKKVAEGAALMSETKMEAKLVTVSSELVPNGPLIEAMQKNLDRLGPPPFNSDDHAYAAKMQATMTEEDVSACYGMTGLKKTEDKSLADFTVPPTAPIVDLPGSTDVGDVSWVVPTVQMWGANYAIGTPFHTWQMVAQGKSEPAIKGMTHAAQVMAATGVDVILDADLRARAKSDLEARIGPQGYISPLPDDAVPPIEEMAGQS
ncbi:M20 family metallopeptidase [Marimonas arenosa]|uniref:M20 family metallopeptidase n=1 Tax=Marimonas arenosa TaxID=1795305 RepID=A0AAE4B6G3_9RHOB|nr:M20 family metallopeptidase [Marimonas arenosa]MDQ2092300.1 M20 family metallopeptidase [Marimonas arenosa]